ncbi:MAG: flotillin-like protein FloA [bacterium]|nr:flotillin-like protein FloA [bacterium]
MQPEFLFLFILLVAILLFASFILYIVPVRLYIAARAARVPISLAALVGMRLRRIPPSEIIDPLTMAVQAGLDITHGQLESLWLSGGNVASVVKALIAADKARIPLGFDRARAIDLAGRNVYEAVKMSVQPKVIDCPDPTKGRETIDAVAKNGIQLKAKARVTVRANLERLIGGATEETIIARVGEGIVTTIGSADTHKHVLENPDMISKRVLERGLDSGTAFEILSIDIADIDVGVNIGAKLQIDQAEADKQIAQAKAEERRALAIAREQEMRALEQEMQARVVEAEAEVPRAMAEAFRHGNLGIMDYYKMQNIKADTEMRTSLSGAPAEPPRKG